MRLISPPETSGLLLVVVKVTRVLNYALFKNLKTRLTYAGLTNGYTALSLDAKCFSPVVSDRKLQAIVVGVESVSEVDAPSELEFRSDHDLLDRVEQQIADGVVTLMESRWKIPVGILYVHHRIADRSGEPRTPVVIEE